MIPFTHKTTSRSRAIRLKIEPNGSVIVTSPPRTPTRLIERFVSEHQDWIHQTQILMAQRRSKADTENEIYVFGKASTKHLQQNSATPPGVYIVGNQLVITVLPSLHQPSPENINKQVKRFLKNTAEKYIVPRTYQIAQAMDISFGSITLREQKTRWGSCSSAGNLNFNWRLVHAPPAVIDYVIVHELAHRKHMDHSPAFWNLVGRYDPEFPKHRGWLKRHGMAVG